MTTTLSRPTARTLVMMHVESNVGFAITPLETLFAKIALELNAGDPTGVHFSYTHLNNGRPANLPGEIRVIAHDQSIHSGPEIDRLCQYVRENRIEFLLSFDQQPIASSYRALRRAGVKCIVSYWGAEISSRNPAWKRMLKMAQILVNRSRLDGLIFESQAMADLARYGRGVPESLIDVVPLGIDLDRFSAERSDYVYEQFPIARDKKVVVYAGHMEERKGVKTLIEAAALLLKARNRQDVAFLLFGDRPGEKERFYPLYQPQGLDKDILFAGYRSDLHRCFSSCHIGVIPSSGWDSFPRTSIELAASGLPLVVSRLGGLPEAIRDGETGFLFPPGDAGALADRLSLLLDDPQQAATMGRRGRVRCEENFSTSIQEQRLREAILRRLHTTGLV